MHDIVIVGSGFAGLGAAVALTGAGRDDFVILERARASAAPGATTPIPAAPATSSRHLYSFSFAPNPDWTRAVRRASARSGPTLSDVADRFGLRPHPLRRGGDRRGVGRRQALGGRHDRRPDRADAGSSCGPPARCTSRRSPTIQGLDTFTGTVFHSARWNHEHDLGGRRVAVIGTGRQRDPVRATGAAAGGAAHPLPAHRRHGCCPSPTARSPTSCAGCTGPCPARRSWRGRWSTRATSCSSAASVNPRRMRVIDRVARAYLGRALAGRPDLRPPPPPTSPSAASASCSPTTTTRRCAAQCRRRDRGHHA